MTAVQRGRVLNEADFNRQFGALNRRNPDLRVVPVLRPGRAPGTVEAELKVRDELPLHAEVELNNDHSEDTSDLRLRASLSYGNLWQADHKLTLLALTSPRNTDEVRVLSANYMLPLAESDDRLLLYAMRTDSAVETIGGITVIGDGSIFGANLVKPLPSSPRLFHTLLAGVEYRDLVNVDPVSEEPLRYLRFAVNWLGRRIEGEGVHTNFDLGLAVGLKELVNNEDEFRLNRQGAKPGFLLGNFELEHVRRSTRRGSLRLALDGQYTPEPLISNLQFAAGGVDSVRGYFQSMVLADNGLRLSTQWDSPNLWPRIGPESRPSRAEWTVHTFVDAAWLWDRSPSVSGQRHTKLTSFGVGSRLEADDRLFAALDLAWPFTAQGSIDSGDPMLHFRVGYGL
jgi:hemolysin activation/secretion protein